MHIPATVLGATSTPSSRHVPVTRALIADDCLQHFADVRKHMPQTPSVTFTRSLIKHVKGSPPTLRPPHVKLARMWGAVRGTLTTCIMPRLGESPDDFTWEERASVSHFLFSFSSYTFFSTLSVVEDQICRNNDTGTTERYVTSLLDDDGVMDSKRRMVL